MVRFVAYCPMTSVERGDFSRVSGAEYTVLHGFLLGVLLPRWMLVVTIYVTMTIGVGMVVVPVGMAVAMVVAAVRSSDRRGMVVVTLLPLGDFCHVSRQRIRSVCNVPLPVGPPCRNNNLGSGLAGGSTECWLAEIPGGYRASLCPAWRSPCQSRNRGEDMHRGLAEQRARR